MGNKVYQVPYGTKDILPGEMKARRGVENAIINVFDKWGYDEVKTPDFEYAETMCYSANAVEIAKKLIASGADIVTDTNMAKSGINKKALEKFGGQVHCFMADDDVAKEARDRKVTRATVSMERAAKLTEYDGDSKELDDFDDADTVNSWAYSAAKFIPAHGTARFSWQAVAVCSRTTS